MGGKNIYPCNCYPYGTFPKLAIEYFVVFNNKSLFPKVYTNKVEQEYSTNYAIINKIIIYLIKIQHIFYNILKEFFNILLLQLFNLISMI